MPAGDSPGNGGQKTKSEPEAVEKKIEFPILGDDNAVEFLTAYGKEHPETRVIVETRFGEIELELYEDTPLHRANFLYLIEREYYCPTEIIRIVKNFVVQGGNSDEEIPAFRRSIIGKYTLPAEIRNNHVHHKGALAMSRSYVDNPDKRSSAYDFYIVHGTVPQKADFVHQKLNGTFPHTQAQLDEYARVGGAIHLDGEHTVFGRVVRGLGIIDTIANLPTDGAEWPKEEVLFDMHIKDAKVED